MHFNRREPIHSWVVFFLWSRTTTLLSKVLFWHLYWRHLCEGIFPSSFPVLIQQPCRTRGTRSVILPPCCRSSRRAPEEILEQNMSPGWLVVSPWGVNSGVDCFPSPCGTSTNKAWLSVFDQDEATRGKAQRKRCSGRVKSRWGCEVMMELFQSFEANM